MKSLPTFIFAFFLFGCGGDVLNPQLKSQWQDAQPTEQVNEAYATWKQIAAACLPKIEAGQLCYIPPSPITMVYQAGAESRREGLLAGIETFGAVAGQLAPLLLPTAVGVGLSQ